MFVKLIARPVAYTHFYFNLTHTVQYMHACRPGCRGAWQGTAGGGGDMYIFIARDRGWSLSGFRDMHAYMIYIEREIERDHM